MTNEDLAEMRCVCSGAQQMTEGGVEFVSLPALRIAVGTGEEIRDALLSLTAHTGYTSRLYLSAPIPSKGQNWTSHTVLGRTWHTPSFNNIQPGRATMMLADHLRVYR